MPSSLLPVKKGGKMSMLNTQCTAQAEARVYPGMLDYITIKWE